MYQKLLVPLDGSTPAELAIDQAEGIARLSGGEIILLRVVENPMARLPEAGPAGGEISSGAKAVEARAYLDAVVKRIKERGTVRVRAEVVAGTPYAAIIGLAHKEDVGLIVMSTHGHTGLARAIMGSVAEQVVYATQRPVLLVKPDKALRRRSLGTDSLAKTG